MAVVTQTEEKSNHSRNEVQQIRLDKNFLGHVKTVSAKAPRADVQVFNVQFQHRKLPPCPSNNGNSSTSTSSTQPVTRAISTKYSSKTKPTSLNTSRRRLWSLLPTNPLSIVVVCVSHEIPDSFVPVNIESALSRGLPRSCLPLFPCHAVVDDILMKRQPIIGIFGLVAKAPYSIVK